MGVRSTAPTVGSADDERRDLNEALDEAVHLVARIETVTS